MNEHLSELAEAVAEARRHLDRVDAALAVLAARPPEPEPTLLSIDEAAARLRVARSSLFGLMEHDGFPSVRLGGRRLVPTAALEEWVRSRSEVVA